MSDTILLGTRKGTVMIDRQAGGWRARPIIHDGVPVCYATRDPRNGTLWASLDHGHWGPKLSRSRDGGDTWEDISSLKYPEGARHIVQYLPTPDFDPEAPVRQPEYAEATVYKIWHIAFGGVDQPGRLYAGTIPGGLFVSDDGGDSCRKFAWWGKSRALVTRVSVTPQAMNTTRPPLSTTRTST